MPLRRLHQFDVRPDPRSSLGLAVIVVALLVGGCESWYRQRIVHDSFADLREMAGQQRQINTHKGDPQGAAKRKGYAILIQEFEGPHHARRADRLVQRLVTEAHAPDLWVQTLDDRGLSRVLRGVYPTPDVDLAVQHLRQTRMLMINGARPYQKAGMVSLAQDGLATGDPFDLRQHAGKMSVQIAYYDAQFGADFRKAAEQAVHALRDDGVSAFFYHGPNLSMVCIGVFDENDRIQQEQRTSDGKTIVSATYSDRVRLVRQKFPYNLGNGRQMLVKNPDGSQTPMASFLVQVPDRP